MAAVKVITVKSFTYRGQPEEWSNAYHLSGANPADEAAVHTLINAIRDAEKACWTSDVVFNRGYLYNSGSTTADYVYDQTASALSFRQGTLAAGTSVAAPGDDAMWVRWVLPGRRARGKQIYLRKYFHGVRLPAGGGDALFPAQRTALIAFGTAMADGSLPLSRKVCDESGLIGTDSATSANSTTRTLKRRGRRPPPP